MARDLSSINKVRDLNLITVDIPKKEGCKNTHNPIHKGPLVLGPKTIHFVIQSPSQGLSPVSKDATTASFNQTPFPLCISVLSHYHASTLSLSLSLSLSLFVCLKFSNKLKGQWRPQQQPQLAEPHLSPACLFRLLKRPFNPPPSPSAAISPEPPVISHFLCHLVCVWICLF